MSHASGAHETPDETSPSKSSSGGFDLRRLTVGNLPWVVAALSSLILAAWLYQWWNAPLGVPFAYDGDALTNAMAFKAVLEDGAIWNNERLGAPFGQHYQDWPLTDLLPLYFGAAFAVLTGANWAVAMNAFFIATFPAIAIAAWWVLRKFGVSPWLATALAVIYSLAPYHFGRGEEHIFLSGYFGVPLGVWIAVSLFDRELYGKRSTGNRIFRYLTWPTLRTAFFATVITASSIYYAVFTVLMIAIVVAVQLLRRDWKVVVPAGAVLGVMGVTFVLLAAPTFAYRADNGPNVLGAQRSQADTEVYGLKLSQMVLPTHGHRVDEFESLRLDYVREFPVPAEQSSTSIGAVATVGLLALLAVGLLSMLNSKPSSGDERRRQLSLLTVVMFFIATVGGVSTLISLLLTSQIRGWNRVSIVIAFMALAALGLMVQSLLRRWPIAKKWWLATPVLSGLVVLAALDQFPPSAVPPYSERAAVFNNDAEFFGRVEAALPTGAAVYQLPVIPFPEPLKPVYEDMKPYDPMRPYLHTRDLRWSYGGIEGRVESDWQSRLPVNDTDALVRSLVATGFDGIYIDRFAYEDRAAPLEATLTSLTGTAAMESINDRMSFFDLRPVATKLRQSEASALDQLRRELLFPVITQISSRDYRREVDETGETFAWAPEDVTVPVVNESETGQRTVIDFEITVGNGKPSTFDITWPDGEKEILTGGPQEFRASREFVAPPGRSDIFIDSNTERLTPPNDFRILNFKIGNVRVRPAQ